MVKCGSFISSQKSDNEKNPPKSGFFKSLITALRNLPGNLKNLFFEKK